jgi:hypothetical protein
MARDTVNLKLLKPTSGFMEWGDSTAFAFCSVTPELSQANRPGTCRGEQIGTIYSSVQGDGGHYYPVEKDAIGFDKIRIIVQSVRLKDSSLVDSIESFLNQFETEMGIELTVVKKISNIRTGCAYYFEGDQHWLSCPMFSLYCFLIRNMFQHNYYKETWEESFRALEVARILDKDNLSLIKDIVKYGPKAIFGEDPKKYYEHEDIYHSSYHDFGFQNTASDSTFYLHGYHKKLITEVHKRLKMLKSAQPTNLQKVLQRVKRKGPIGVEV